MFDIGMPELIVIFIVALIVFGPKKLPELGRTIGKSLAELKKAVQGVKEQMDSEMRSIEYQDTDKKHEEPGRKTGADDEGHGQARDEKGSGNG